MNDEYPKVSIVIPVYNEERYLSDCLESVFHLDYPSNNFEVIIVDNGSTDSSVEIASKFNTQVLIKIGVKVGAVRNYGAMKSSGDIIVFLDSDCLVEKSWLKDGVQLITQDQYHAVGGLFLLRESPSWIEKNWILRSSRSYVYQKTFIGACIFITKETFNSVGGFNEDLNAGEDCYLTNQLLMKGYKIKIDPKLSVVHLGYPSTISGFVKRQLWHSSDYLSRLNTIFSDKTMLVVSLFLACFVSIPIILASSASYQVIFIPLLGIICLPLILSVKRIFRYGGYTGGADLISIYLVDILYLVSRVGGLLSGLFRKIFVSSGNKTFK